MIDAAITFTPLEIELIDLMSEQWLGMWREPITRPYVTPERMAAMVSLRRKIREAQS